MQNPEPFAETMLKAVSQILKGRLTLVVAKPPETTDPPVDVDCRDLVADSHWHWEIFLPLTEEANYQVGSACYAVRPRMALVCGRWTPHALHPAGPGSRKPAQLIIHGHENVWCNIPLGDDDPIAHDSQSLWATMPLEVSTFVHSRWTAFHESPLSHKKAAETFLRRPVELVLEEYLRLVYSHGAIRSTETPADIVTLVKGRIESLNGAGCALSDMARFAGYSRCALAHLFKTQTGMSIGEYRDQVRRDYLCRAQVLGLKTKEIAVDLGFSSSAAYLNWKSSRSSRRLDAQSPNLV